VDTPGDGLRILAADEDQAALERTVDLLGRLGHDVTATAVDLAQVTEAIAREEPQLSVVVVHRDDEHALDLMEEISAFASGPIIALLASENAEFGPRSAGSTRPSATATRPRCRARSRSRCAATPRASTWPTRSAGSSRRWSAAR
jgi:CheY-like chemotaxis protein